MTRICTSGDQRSSGFSDAGQAFHARRSSPTIAHARALRPIIIYDRALGVRWRPRLLPTAAGPGGVQGGVTNDAFSPVIGAAQAVPGPLLLLPLSRRGHGSEAQWVALAGSVWC